MSSMTFDSSLENSKSKDSCLGRFTFDFSDDYFSITGSYFLE
jgi:hypothetical protein